MRYLVKLTDKSGSMKNVAVVAEDYSCTSGVENMGSIILSFYNRISTNIWVEALISLASFVGINLYNLRKKAIVSTIIIPPNTIAEVINKGDD